MKTYRYYKEQKLPVTIKEAWDFFSSPKNLVKITPPAMKFKITNNPAEDIFPGKIITYKVRPIFNISLNWITELVHLDKPYYFIDEQRFGPYKFWYHIHSFEEIPEGILIKDEVYYALPYGVMGRIINSIMVKNRIKEIFEYRKVALKELFPGIINTPVL